LSGGEHVVLVAAIAALTHQQKQLDSHCCCAVRLLCLQAVIGNQEADHSARWLAAVQLKNSVNKYWRPRYDSGCACRKTSAAASTAQCSQEQHTHCNGPSKSPVFIAYLLLFGSANEKRFLR
jgi:hypothetical protein